MPLLAPGTDTGTPPAPPPDPAAPPSLASFITWTPNGRPERILTWPSAVALRAGTLGVDMPTDQYFESVLAVGDGSITQSRRALPREVTLPVVLWNAADVADRESQRRALLRDFDPRLGIGQLVWATPDGGRRTLFCQYVSGLESQDGGRLRPNLIANYDIVLRAVDPYWYGDPVVQSFAAPAGQPFLPGPPFFISESTTFGNVTVTIDGEVETFPQWVITGPATTATLVNVDTGRSLDLTPGLAAGQTLTIRTDPRTLASQKFTNNAGANVWGSSAGQFPVLWPLRPGTNNITVTASGTTAASQIRLTYSPRYLTA